MSEHKDDDDSPAAARLPDLASDITASAAGALIGIVLAGPAGALAGAATGPLAKATIEIATASLRARNRRTQAALEQAIKLVEDQPRPLEELLIRDEERLDVAIAALNSAAASSVEAKLEALGACIARAATLERVSDVERLGLLVKALADLEAVHLAVLSHLADRQAGYAVTPTQLESDLRLPAEELRPVVRQLELNGLILDQGRFEAQPAAVKWELSGLGRLCVALLRGNLSDEDIGQGDERD